jgi:hypothetical protein
MGTLILFALLATTLPAEAAPKIAMIEVKGMVCSA